MMQCASVRTAGARAWRSRTKDLACETIPWRFTDKDAIAVSGQGKVPVLLDGERCVSDSWAIAEYLETTYPARPSLFGGVAGRALVRFVNQWTSEVLHMAIARAILPELYAILHEKDRDYFRSTREAALGISLTDLAAQREDALVQLCKTVQPLRSTLAAQPFLAGAAPNYADHVAFAAFQWARIASPVVLLAEDDTVRAWCERMLDAYGGIARAAPRATP